MIRSPTLFPTAVQGRIIKRYMAAFLHGNRRTLLGPIGGHTTDSGLHQPLGRTTVTLPASDQAQGERTTLLALRTVIALILAVGACSRPTTESLPSASESSGIDPPLSNVASQSETIDQGDIDLATAYFSGFSVGPEGPELPESTRANQLVGGCLESFGVAVSYAGGGGIYRFPNPSQQPREEALVDLCFRTMANQGLVSFSETDPVIARRRYEAYLVAFECLTEEGVDPDPPISLDAFLDGQSWSPFNGIPNFVNSEEGIIEGPAVECAVP